MKGSSGGNSRQGVRGFSHHEEEVGAAGTEFNDQSNSMGIEGGWDEGTDKEYGCQFLE